jgi:hypothetical protein
VIRFLPVYRSLPAWRADRERLAFSGALTKPSRTRICWFGCAAPFVSGRLFYRRRRRSLAAFACSLSGLELRQLWPPEHPGRLRIRWPSRVHHQRIWLAGVPCRLSLPLAVFRKRRETGAIKLLPEFSRPALAMGQICQPEIG